MVSMTSIKGMDARHKGMWTYVYRGNRRTSIGEIDVRPERMGTYIRRACHYRRTSSRLPWNARSTGVSRSAHSSGNPDGAIRGVFN